MITRGEVAAHVEDYLRDRITREQLVHWAENSLMDGDLDEPDAALIARALGRLGVADVRAFGLAWEDCRELLASLGYEARMELRKIA